MLRLLLYVTAVLHFTTCNSMELCQGDNQCILCTVTGPSVIDVLGQVNSVQDRCMYTLMKTPFIPDVQVHGTFQERRRKDVSFLDRVILSLDKPRVHIYLEQGGRVHLNNSLMMLNTTAQPVHGMELSKDQTGVTAKASLLNYTMTVFFDGYTAQIHIKGPSGQALPVEGLCGNSSRSFSDARLSDTSATSCDKQYNDTTDDSRINCNKTTERCNLLKTASFTACHSNIDPEPYITACSKTLCKYPEVDGLKCQFLEAYAKACSLHNNTLESWRLMANCSAEPQAFCQDRFCSADEFCGEKSIGDGTRCHCRAIFASTYRSQNSLGDAMVCNKTLGSVSLVGCLLEDKGIHYSDLHLYDKTCRGEMDNVTHMMTIDFDANTDPCGAMIRINNQNQMINKNSIIVETTNEELMDFSCPFVIPEINIDFSMDITVKSGSSNNLVTYVTSGIWNYTVTMKAYTDAGRMQAVDVDTKLHLNQRVWFEMKADGLDDKMVALVTQSCFATDKLSADSNLKYDLITKGCPNPLDKTVIVESNGQGTSDYFSFTIFQFSGKTGEVYLHCKLNLCVTESNSCAPICNPNARRRRSATDKYEHESPVDFIMAWGT